MVEFENYKNHTIKYENEKGNVRATLFNEKDLGYSSFLKSKQKEAEKSAKFEIDKRVDGKVNVKAHTKTINGKQVEVKSYEKSLPKNANAKEVWEADSIPKDILSKGNETTYFVKQHNNENKYFVESRDDLLELNSVDGWARSGEKEYKHFPNYKWLKSEDKNKYNYDIYETKYTKPLTKSDSKAWKDFKVLQEAQDIVTSKKMNAKNWDSYKESEAFSEALDSLETKSKKISPKLREEFESTNSDSTNYGSDVRINLTKGTTRVSKDGELILNNIYYRDDK